MNLVVIINMLGNDGVLLTLHSHMLLCTFTFLVAQTSGGIHTKNILKVPNIFIIVFFYKSSHHLKVVSWHPFFNCTIVVVWMCFNHYYAIVVVLASFISIVSLLLFLCFHHYYIIVIVLEFLQLWAFTMCEITRN